MRIRVEEAVLEQLPEGALNANVHKVEHVQARGRHGCATVLCHRSHVEVAIGKSIS